MILDLRAKYQSLKKTLLLAMVLAGLLAPCLSAQTPTWPYDNETKEQRDARMGWWRDARFGMFIHWGVYAVPAGTYDGKRIDGIGEWIMLNAKIPVAEYKAYAKQFNPVKYDPDAWVRLAKEAGMNYIVITSKHHDGFALFDSKVTDWDIVDATPYGQDLLKPLAEACRKHGIKLGFYYSQAQDWCHPGGAVRKGSRWDPAQEGSMDDYLRTIAAPQVKEILSNYGDIAVLWWDTPNDMSPERAAMFEPVVSQYPGIITNNRLGGGYKGDTDTPEQAVPAIGLGDRDWETCMTMNDTWGYKSYDDNWKSPEKLIRNLIDIASKGGNYLLNVGPTAEGEIPQPSVERLKAIGRWMKDNGEAIYGTTASPFAKLDFVGRCTQKKMDSGALLYLHVFDWPQDGKLLAAGLNNEIKSARLLATGQPLSVKATPEGPVISVPANCPDPIATVIELKVEGVLDIQPLLPKQDAYGTVMLPALWSDIHILHGYRAQTRLETSQGLYHIGNWGQQSFVEWKFEVDQPGVFDIVALAAAQEESTAEIKLIETDTVYKAKFPPTGGADTFETIPVGTVTIEKTGLHTLQIWPVNKQWNPINLRFVTLRPRTK